MAAPTYKARALVLRKTKLGEKDLIITLLDDRGAKIQAIAKGARKPGGSHAAKLDLFSEIEGLFSKGKSIDIICESKLLTGGIAASMSLEQATVAQPIAEVLSYIAQEDLEQPHLYELSAATFERLRRAQGEVLLTLCTAALWKILAQAGFMPSFDTCVLCGDTIEQPYAASSLDSTHQAQSNTPPMASQRRFFSYADGGVVCDSCATSTECVSLEANVLAWCNYLINERFDAIEEHPLQANYAFALLDLARTWTRYHIDKNIRSIDFLLSSGLFTSD